MLYWKIWMKWINYGLEWVEKVIKMPEKKKE